MKRKFLIPSFFLFLLINLGFKGESEYDRATRIFVLHFPYRHYIGKSFGEFYRDFKAKGDAQKIEMYCHTYTPKPGMTEGCEIRIGHGYDVAAFFHSDYYTPDFHDTIPKSYECTCIQNDTAKIVWFKLFKDMSYIKGINANRNTEAE